MVEVNDFLLGLSEEAGIPTSESDGTFFGAVDDGALYVAYCGRWHKQPIAWALFQAISACQPLPPEDDTDPADGDPDDGAPADGGT